MVSLRRLLSAILLLAFFACAFSFNPINAVAQDTDRKIGTQFEATADPRVPRPNETPCVVTLFTDFKFAHFSESTQTFSYNPPSDCTGPFGKVVLEVNFSENAGAQFDRTASIYLNDANIYFGTTPEPLLTDTNTWHIERDITHFAALLAAPQAGTIVLQNCTSDCGAPYNTLNGVFTVSAKLQFYPQMPQTPAVETPDAVLPLVQTNSGGGVNLPAFLFTPTDQFSTTFTLPTNVERAYLDIVSQSQSDDEQWYACFPNDLASINDFYGCGNTDFRETEISIDGTPAGLAPVSPWVFTGFLPDVWVPTPGAQTLDFVPYRVNLTPFASLLSDGNPHTVSLSVFNDDSYFSEAATLLLFLDHGSTQVTGEVTKNNLALPNPVVVERVKGTSTVKGTIDVRENRDYQINGYVNTSHGKVVTSIFGAQRFTSVQAIDFGSTLSQNTSVQNSVTTTTTVQSESGRTVTTHTWDFPITVDVLYPVAGAEFGFTENTTQNYQSNTQVVKNGLLTSFSSVTNTVHGTDISPNDSSQTYTSFDSAGNYYSCSIASQANTLTSVSTGCSK